MLGFPKRDNASHRESGNRYADLTTESAPAKYATNNAVRWSEFARLPYFDLVRMIVVDPMHNLLLGTSTAIILLLFRSNADSLGLVKTHFYHIWVQGKVLRKTKELRGLHKILSEVCPEVINLISRE